MTAFAVVLILLGSCVLLGMLIRLLSKPTAEHLFPEFSWGTAFSGISVFLLGTAYFQDAGPFKEAQNTAGYVLLIVSIGVSVARNFLKKPAN